MLVVLLQGAGEISRLGAEVTTVSRPEALSEADGIYDNDVDAASESLQ